jgi:hypothetical protein
MAERKNRASGLQPRQPTLVAAEGLDALPARRDWVVGRGNVELVRNAVGGDSANGRGDMGGREPSPSGPGTRADPSEPISCQEPHRRGVGPWRLTRCS